MRKILGLDLGTNSIGWTIRDLDQADEQFIDWGVLTFDKGVAGSGKDEEPLVKVRTLSRGRRRNYQARKYRKWLALETLINAGMCPLTIDELDKWRKYRKGLPAEYPLNPSFINWLRLDFNGDGVPEYVNPYELRALASENKLENKSALGRVFYHLAQRRGFRGRDENESKTIKEGSKEKDTVGADYIQNVMSEKNIPLGAALYDVNKNTGARIRNRYTWRYNVADEFRQICAVNGIDENTQLFKNLFKAIDWQRPLRTQKGNVGHCMFERNKPRCPVSHPLFEEFRARAFINNIKTKDFPEDKFRKLEAEEREALFDKLKSSKAPLDFEKLIRTIDRKNIKIYNYHPKTSVAGCPITAGIELFLGPLEDINIPHKPHEKRTEQKAFYNYDDIWHIIYSSGSDDKLKEFAKAKLNLSEDDAGKFSKIKPLQGYASLSLSAIKKIIPFLRAGYIYSDAVFLAGCARALDINGNKGTLDKLISGYNNLTGFHLTDKKIRKAANKLIARHMEADPEERRGLYPGYAPTAEDEKEVRTELIREYGEETWGALDPFTKKDIIKKASDHYFNYLQTTPATDKRLVFGEEPRFDERIKNYLEKNWGIKPERLNLLYHPSENEIYGAPDEKEGKKYLPDPQPLSKGLKNPMAMKTLYRLKKLINYLIEKGKIDGRTKVVVEIARELNDMNKRKAIYQYNNEREKENAKYAEAVREMAKEQGFDVEPDDKMIDKYRLWLEQDRRCIYTGKSIGAGGFFNGTAFDLEHTIPASLSFDNELKNLTLCDSYYNRTIKGNKIPSELPNYEKEAVIGGVTYGAIKPRLKLMEEKKEHFRQQLEYWKSRSKSAADKEKKDECIQKKHYFGFHYDYWNKKLKTFTLEEYKPEWRNSQLRDTQVITKYAYHYLKTVFVKADVQKAEVVDAFKKIYDLNFKKDRSKHFHHAVDAAVLTLIPSSKQREELLEEYYAAIEKGCGFSARPAGWKNFNAGFIKQIENETVINYLKDDRTLTPTYKNIRKRGKKQFLKTVDENGKQVFRVDEEGAKIPLKARGDSIRGRLHKETFYGKIIPPGADEPAHVLRVPLKNLSEKQIGDIVDPALQKAVENALEEYKKQGYSFKEAIARDIWMTGKDGKPKKFDKNGKPLNPVRHVRCKARAGIGYLSKTNPLKKQTFLSDKDYKRDYHVQTDTNVYYLLYENIEGEAVKRTYRIIDLLELSRFNIEKSEDLAEIPGISVLLKGKPPRQKEYKLTNIISAGMYVIMIPEAGFENPAPNSKEVFNNLYKVYKFNEMGTTGYLYLQHHMEARKDADFNKNEVYTYFDENFIQPRLKLSADKLNCLFEGSDFNVRLDGSIVFT